MFNFMWIDQTIYTICEIDIIGFQQDITICYNHMLQTTEYQVSCYVDEYSINMYVIHLFVL